MTENANPGGPVDVVEASPEGDVPQRQEWEVTTKLLAELDERLAPLWGRPPYKNVSSVDRVLYHYTTPAGLMGILETGELWASDAAHTNDSLELSYGTKLVRDVVGFSESSVLLSDPRPGGAFVACLSEDVDSLSQWRAYAADGLGYALGFRLAELPQVPGMNDASPYLIQVGYDELQQRQLAGEIRETYWKVQEWFDEQPKSEPEERQGNDRLMWSFLGALRGVANTSKHPSFASEREWRLLVTNHISYLIPGACLKYRVSRFGISPYLPLRFASGLPLAEVVLGPRIPWEIGRTTIRGLLKQRGYPSPGSTIEIKQSKASYR